ncbi:Geranylgeranyl diphosphate synthase [Kitasatospora sp. MMS16-BH015]|uniref:polyprenyl synthetase family protein n=1 Tax=Kitasatospora sp. MMS16-BH015 TaxID=2018025 RepID=UPI000CA31D3E|nr:polyprenyl synthetase family protein [Kitasatospora sp. MMS16-BH015]AUG81581.1 Geranylgeranyl diphosphate synthase [Kitasatospora sp. MMS16-BH015]
MDTSALPLDPAGIRAEVDRTIDSLLDTVRAQAADQAVLPLIEELRLFLAGGKRIRPVLCVLGWYAAGGTDTPRPVLSLAAALELMHASLLIHDDLIDRSQTRRGRPTTHVSLAERRRAQTPAEEADRYGADAALLLGDLTMTWSDQLVRTAVHFTPRQLNDILPLLDRLRFEVLTGQYLDLAGSGRPDGDVEAALAITRLKTAHYTIERPLQLGTLLAQSDPALLTACTRFGIPLGEAFQLRDDLLGVFGDPSSTGKPVLDDLREGKRTPLLAIAHGRATPAQRAVLESLVGKADLDTDGAGEVVSVLERTGARATVEKMIAERHAAALQALDAAPFRPAAALALRRIAAQAVQRSA